MKILKEETKTPTSISGTCVFNYFVKKYPNNQKTPKTEVNDWNLVGGQLHRLYKDGQIIVFKPDGEYSIREGYGKGKIDKIIKGTKGKWVCDGDSDYFIEYDNGNFLSTKIRQRFDITNPNDKIAIDIIKQKLKLNDISDQKKPELEKLSTKLDEYKEDIKTATWWVNLKSTWETVKKKVKETLDNLPTTSNSTEKSGAGGESTRKKLGKIIKPDNPEVMDITFTYKYPGDKNWIYGVKGGDWFAKNVKNQNVFNISKDGFQTSVDRLNATFPDAFKSENNKETKKETDNKTTFKAADFKPIEKLKPIDYSAEITKVVTPKINQEAEYPTTL
jgi:hypothetical protein